MTLSPRLLAVCVLLQLVSTRAEAADYYWGGGLYLDWKDTSAQGWNGSPDFSPGTVDEFHLTNGAAMASGGTFYGKLYLEAGELVLGASSTVEHVVMDAGYLSSAGEHTLSGLVEILSTSVIQDAVGGGGTLVLAAELVGTGALEINTQGQLVDFTAANAGYSGFCAPR